MKATTCGGFKTMHGVKRGVFERFGQISTLCGKHPRAPRDAAPREVEASVIDCAMCRATVAFREGRVL